MASTCGSRWWCRHPPPPAPPHGDRRPGLQTRRPVGGAGGPSPTRGRGGTKGRTADRPFVTRAGRDRRGRGPSPSHARRPPRELVPIGLLPQRHGRAARRRRPRARSPRPRRGGTGAATRRRGLRHHDRSGRSAPPARVSSRGAVIGTRVARRAGVPGPDRRGRVHLRRRRGQPDRRSGAARARGHDAVAGERAPRTERGRGPDRCHLRWIARRGRPDGADGARRPRSHGVRQPGGTRGCATFRDGPTEGGSSRTSPSRATGPR